MLSFHICEMSIEYVKNPETGRDIKVGGPTYMKLKNKHHLETAPIITKSAPSRREPIRHVSETTVKQMMEMNLYRPDWEKTITTTKQPTLQKKLTEQMKKRNEGRGSRTRGWSADAPKRGYDRHLLKQRCGDKCFLQPETEGFPICPRCVDNQCNCEIDCRGLTAARIRARQYKYDELESTINQLMDLKCRPKT